MKGLLKFMAGVIVGGVAAALLTPTTGEDLQRRIKEALKCKGLLPDKGIDGVIEMIAAEIEDGTK